MHDPARSTGPEPSSSATANQNLAIGILSVTAVVLLVGLLVVSAVQDRALAGGMSDRGGDYILVTMQFNRGTENLVVTDAATKRILVYGYDIGSKRVDVWSGVDLARLQEQPGAGRRPGEAPPRGGRRNPPGRNP